MGISTRKLVNDFKRKKNLIDSADGQDIPLTTIISCLNEAQKLWFRHKAKEAQENEEIRNDLRVFKEDLISLELIPKDKKVLLAKYPPDLYKRLNQVAFAVKDCCPGFEKKIIPRIITSDELYEALNNPLRKPDFFFEQLLAIETQDGLLIYHDGEMDIIRVVIDYYRKPKEVHAPTLEKCDGEYYYDYEGKIITKDQDCEIGEDTFADLEIVNLAVAINDRDVKDLKAFQSQVSLILGIKDLYKS